MELESTKIIGFAEIYYVMIKMKTSIEDALFK